MTVIANVMARIPWQGHVAWLTATGVGYTASSDFRTIVHQTFKLAENPDNVLNAFTHPLDYFTDQFEHKLANSENPSKYLNMSGTDRTWLRELTRWPILAAAYAYCAQEYSGYVSSASREVATPANIRRVMKYMAPLFLWSTLASSGMIQQVRPLQDLEGVSPVMSFVRSICLFWDPEYANTDLIYSFICTWAVATKAYMLENRFRNWVCDTLFTKNYTHLVPQICRDQFNSIGKFRTAVREALLNLEPDKRATTVLGKWWQKSYGNPFMLRYTLLSWAMSATLGGLIAIGWKIVQGYRDGSILYWAGLRPSFTTIPNDIGETFIRKYESPLSKGRLGFLVGSQALYWTPSILTMDLCWDQINERRFCYEMLNKTLNRKILYSGGDQTVIAKAMETKRKIFGVASEQELEAMRTDDASLKQIRWLRPKQIQIV